MIFASGVGCGSVALARRGHMPGASNGSSPGDRRPAGRGGALELGMPGYRMRLPEKVHPISAGVKGGLPAAS